MNGNNDIERIAFEEVQMRHASIAAGHAYGGFLGTLTAWCEAHQIPYEGVPVGVIKKHATGKGNAPKEAMIKAMRDKGHSPKDDNEADALAILYWLKDHATPRPARIRPAPDLQPARRLPLVPVLLARRPVSR
jgi:Holliday junction resolvasome RuvABC endonuclease subunit